jgi:hypothetical protein
MQGLGQKVLPGKQGLTGSTFSNSIRLIGLVQAAVLSLDRRL